MGIVFCVSIGAHRLSPRCPEQSPHSTAPFDILLPSHFFGRYATVHFFHGRTAALVRAYWRYDFHCVPRPAARLVDRTKNSSWSVLALDPLVDFFLGSGESEMLGPGFMCLSGRSPRSFLRLWVLRVFSACVVSGPSSPKVVPRTAGVKGPAHFGRRPKNRSSNLEGTVPSTGTGPSSNSQRPPRGRATGWDSETICFRPPLWSSLQAGAHGWNG